MDCYIVCNTFPPSVSNVVRAPGLRAEQLAHQARKHFGRVYYLMLKTRFDMLSRQLADGWNLDTSPDFIVIHDVFLERFLNRIPRSTFVFTQVEFEPFFDAARQNHTVVYDVLAPRELEFAEAGKDVDNVNLVKYRHYLMSERAERVFVNGPKTIEHYREHFERREQVMNNPLCPLSTPTSPRERDKLLFFGSSQLWTDNSPLLEVMCDFLGQRPDIVAYLLTPEKRHEDPESRFISRLSLLPNVRIVNSLSYTAHMALLSQCYAAIDWSRPRSERPYSTSTRMIQAVAAGCAVFTNVTALVHYWRDFPGETSDEPPTLEKISHFVDAARSGEYAPALKDAAAWNEGILSDTALFAGLG